MQSIEKFEQTLYNIHDSIIDEVGIPANKTKKEITEIFLKYQAEINSARKYIYLNKPFKKDKRKESRVFSLLAREGLNEASLRKLYEATITISSEADKILSDLIDSQILLIQFFMTHNAYSEIRINNLKKRFIYYDVCIEILKRLSDKSKKQQAIIADVAHEFISGPIKNLSLVKYYNSHNNNLETVVNMLGKYLRVNIKRGLLSFR